MIQQYTTLYVMIKDFYSINFEKKRVSIVFVKFIRLGFLAQIDRYSLSKLKDKSILQKFELSLVKAEN